MDVEFEDSMCILFWRYVLAPLLTKDIGYEPRFLKLKFFLSVSYFLGAEIISTEDDGRKLPVLMNLTRKLNEHGGIRTPDPQNRNLMLYPLSYMPWHMT